MTTDDILVVKTNITMTKDNYDTLYKSLLRMKEMGVVLVPAFCDVIVTPSDCDIKIDS